MEIRTEFKIGDLVNTIWGQGTVVYTAPRVSGEGTVFLVKLPGFVGHGGGAQYNNEDGEADKWWFESEELELVTSKSEPDYFVSMYMGAVRYALNRKSYIIIDVKEWTLYMKDKLNRTQREMLAEEISNAIKEGVVYSGYEIKWREIIDILVGDLEENDLEEDMREDSPGMDIIEELINALLNKVNKLEEQSTEEFPPEALEEKIGRIRNLICVLEGEEPIY